MQPGRLINVLAITIQILISLVLFLIVLPFFILWRVPISLLYFTKKEPEERTNSDQEKEKAKAKEEGQARREGDEEERKPEPPKDLHDRVLAPYTKQWTAFKKLSIDKPLVTHWPRVACMLLLLTQTILSQTILSLALLEKSLVFHIPWLVAHLSNTQYKTEKKKIWLNDLLLHLAWLFMTCAPVVGGLGVGLGALYYVRKALVYGKFQKDMVRKKGGRGYEVPDDEEQGGVKNAEGHGVKGAIIGVVDHVMHPHLAYPHLHHHFHNGYAERQQENSPYGYSGYSEDLLFEQPGDTMYGHQDTVSAPPMTVQPPVPAARFDKNPYTLAGIASIWTGQKEKLKTGYDGRDTRKQNFAKDVEMAHVTWKN